MSRPGQLSRSRAIAAIQQSEPSNLDDVEIVPEPINTQHIRQAPQFATQASIP
ncbi:hypothetical protein A2U01_0071209, partial [Trifolium medium]|nr:hypothetical protein [Trifolium medium]